MVNRNAIKVRANLKQNRLQITLVGPIAKRELESLYTEIRFCVADLKPGFSVVSDLSQCRIGYLSGISTFMKISDYLGGNGVGVVIRIIKTRALVFRQLSRLAGRNAGYDVIYVSSPEEAEARLAEKADSA